MSDQADLILGDLARHAGLFDLDSPLGDDLADVAAADVAGTFDREQRPDGLAWPDLSGDYARWKEGRFPGEPMGVLTGHLRANLTGEPVRSADALEIPIGADERAADEARWFEDGDDAANRPARSFIGLSESGIETSDQVCERRLDEGL